MNFKIFCTDRNNYQILYGTKVFAGGEVQVRLGKLPVGFSDSMHDNEITIDGIIKNSDMFMELMMLCDALHRCGKVEITLDLHYLPYARQDRVCTPGESFALSQFASLLERVYAHKIIFDDVHSSVAIDLLSVVGVNCRFRTQSDLIAGLIPPHSVLLVSPDNGASSKTDLLSMYSMNDMMQYKKVRDPNSGQIIKTEIDYGEELIAGRDCFIADDILDGGRTFVPIIEDLISKGAKRVFLCTTHAIVPYGIQHLLDSGLSAYFYVNSFLDNDLEGMYHASRISDFIGEE